MNEQRHSHWPGFWAAFTAIVLAQDAWNRSAGLRERRREGRPVDGGAVLAGLFFGTIGIVVAALALRYVWVTWLSTWS